MKETKFISGKEQEHDLDNSLKKVIGKKVLSKSGEEIGKVKDVISKGTNKLDGIMVKTKGAKVFIANTYIENLYAKSVFLKIEPVSRYLKMIVFDKDGSKLGKVIDFTQNESGNELKSIIVKKHIFSKRVEIDAKKITVSKKNIILD